MSLEGQRLDPDRYQIIPRTISFLLRGEQVLLIKLDQSRGAWAGKFNGLGGHVERGENPQRSALREIREETGLTAVDLQLCGVVLIDTREAVGIGLFVFVGGANDGNVRASREGIPSWIPLQDLDRIPLVEDLSVLLPRALGAFERGRPFCALYQYDDELAIDMLPE